MRQLNPTQKPGMFGSVGRVAFLTLPLVLLFFLGRSLEHRVTPFSHEEVVDVIEKCEVGEFVGDCVDCATCPEGEYANGGCSYFKDTFCTWCEPLMHCPRVELRCSDRFDSTCNNCECPDPIQGWGEAEHLYFLNHMRTMVGDGSSSKHIVSQEDLEAVGVEAVTYACYWNEDCRPCRVCGNDNGSYLALDLPNHLVEDEADPNDDDGPGDFYQVAACTQWEDTQCAPCTTCMYDEYTAVECSWNADAVCEPCDFCQPGTFTTHVCSPSLAEEIGGDAECQDCSTCGDDQYVSQKCYEYEHGDTQCTDCTHCAAGEVIEGYYRNGFYIQDECTPGSIWEDGADTVCTACTDHPGTEAGYFEVSPCDPETTVDSVFARCYICTQQEWEDVPCQPSSDTICQDCSPIHHCNAENTVCTTPEDQICACTDEDGCASGHGCESPDFLGEQCCYMRTFTACGGLSYREFTARLAGFEGQGEEEFIDWCRMMCDEYTDCIAFEIVDGGTDDMSSGDLERGTPNSVCHLKDVPSIINDDPSRDCWHNICRQDEDAVLMQLPGYVPPEEATR